MAVAGGRSPRTTRTMPAAFARLNALAEQLAQLDFATAPPSEVGELKREEHLVYNSTLLHELYFECLGDAPTQPSGVFAQALARDFGSLDRWKAEFAAVGKSMVGGSGVAILAYAPRDKRLMIHAAADYAMGPVGCVPLVAMDMHEHAYKGRLRQRCREVCRQLRADDAPDHCRAALSRSDPGVMMGPRGLPARGPMKISRPAGPRWDSSSALASIASMSSSLRPK